MTKHWKAFCAVCFGGGAVLGITLVHPTTLAIAMCVICAALVVASYRQVQQIERTQKFMRDLEELQRVVGRLDRPQQLSRRWERGLSDAQPR